MSDSIETRLEHLKVHSSTPNEEAAQPVFATLTQFTEHRAEEIDSDWDETLQRNHLRAWASRQQSPQSTEASKPCTLDWSTASDESQPQTPVPATSAMHRKVAQAYTAAHGHPLEHDGRVATAKSAARWRFSVKSSVAVLLLIGLCIAVVMCIESWNSTGNASALAPKTKASVQKNDDSVDKASHDAEVSNSEADNATPKPKPLEHQNLNPTETTKRMSSASESSEHTTSVLFVHVAGAVRTPGLYELPATSRVFDAIEAAGGATKKADTNLINLAEPAVDGHQIYVPQHGEQPHPSGPSASRPSTTTNSNGGGHATSGSSNDATALVDINTADQTQLDALPGVGPAIAQRIIDFRDEHGPYSSTNDLQAVSGIGPAMMKKLEGLVSVGGR